ncbi:O-antigen ligase family protein [uncultured Sphingomonas sp.]|uniref:O-antigen ligase family protein n=1 Tax=uncultured Sphingomonas sp. TaxID=158754 RepID=UPI0025E42B37|nr:O-antigen ligase family protein [uncultured Sphingomonas sp.]
MERLGDGQFRTEWGSARTRAAAILLASLLTAEQLAFGANGPLLALLAAAGQMAVAMAVLILLAPPAAFWRAAAPVLILALATIGWVALHALPGHAVAPDLVAPGVVRGIGLFALLLASAWIGYRRGLMRIAIGWIVLIGLVQIATGLILRGIDPGHVWGVDKGILVDRFTGTSLNANATGCLFGVIALLGLGRWLTLMRESGEDRDSGVVARIAAMLGLTMGTGACFITGSRTALLLLVIGLAFVAWRDPLLRRRLLRPKGLALLAVVGFVLIMLALTIGDVTMDRMTMTSTDAVTRVEIWRHYAALAARSWLWGYGPLSFDEVNLMSLRTAEQAHLLWYVHSAHDEILSLLLEGGVPYLVLTIMTMAAILLDIHRHRDAKRADPLLRAMMVATALVLPCAMVDITLDVPAMAALTTVLIGLPWGRAMRRAVDTRYSPR